MTTHDDQYHAPADVCPGYEGSIGDPNVPEACQRATNPMTDQRALDVIAMGLGTISDWGSQEFEWIANVLGEVRPHPGTDDPSRYYIDFLDDTGRDPGLFVDVEKGTCRFCSHDIASLNVGQSWFAPDAGNDDEDGDGIWRETCPDNHTEPAAPHEPEGV